MAPTVNILIPEKNLARNPIVASFYGGNNLSNIFRLYEGAALNQLIYEGVIYNIDNYVRVDLSPFFDNLRKKAGVEKFRICLVRTDGIEYGDKYFEVYGGGISKLLRRKLVAASTDIFNWKLKNPLNNFFLTTRTNAQLIFIPENELIPLCYYGKGLAFNLKVDGQTVATFNHSEDETESLKSIDLNTLRNELVANNHKLISVFDIMTPNGGYVGSIIITQANNASDYFLKFLNSWGVYEMISLNGMIEYNPTFSEATTVLGFDEVILDTVKKQNRKELTSEYKAEIGYKTADERLFLIDALLSDECILVANGMEYPVTVSTDTTLFQDTGNEPKSISLTIKLIDSDENYSPLDDKALNVIGSTASKPITITDFKILA